MAYDLAPALGPCLSRPRSGRGIPAAAHRLRPRLALASADRLRAQHRLRLHRSYRPRHPEQAPALAAGQALATPAHAASPALGNHLLRPRGWAWASAATGRLARRATAHDPLGAYEPAWPATRARLGRPWTSFPRGRLPRSQPLRRQNGEREPGRGRKKRRSGLSERPPRQKNEVALSPIGLASTDAR